MATTYFKVLYQVLLYGQVVKTLYGKYETEGEKPAAASLQKHFLQLHHDDADAIIEVVEITSISKAAYDTIDEKV